MTAKSTLRFPLLLLTALLLASCNFPAPELARPEQPLYIRENRAATQSEAMSMSREELLQAMAFRQTLCK